MRITHLIATAAILFAAPAFAETIKVQVNGVVCAFCAKGIEKSFKKNDAVKSVKVDLETKQVTLVTKPTKTVDDDTITQTITDAGFDVTDIARSN